MDGLNPKRLSLRAKAVIFTFTVVTTISLILIWVGLDFAKGQAVERAKENLNAQLRSRTILLQTFLSGLENDFNLVASRTRLRELLDYHLDGNSDKADFLGDTTKILKDAYVLPFQSENRKTVQLSKILAIDIFTQDGVLTSFPSESHINRNFTDVPNELIFSDLSSIDTNPIVSASGPLFTPKGRKLGLAIKSDVSKVAKLVFSTEGMGRTGKIKLERELSKFPRLESVNTDSLNKADDSLRVFGIEDTGLITIAGKVGYGDWYIVIQKNLDEVFEPLADQRTRLLLVSMPIVLVMLLVSLMITRKFTNPLVRLSGAAEQIALGNHDVKLPEFGFGEFSILAQKFNKMNQAVSEKESELRKLASEADKANHAKDEFLATISHELRTPASIIIGFVDLLRSNENLSKEEVIKYLDTIAKNAQNELKLIEDILETSAILTGNLKLNPSPIQLSEVIEEVVENSKIAIGAKEIKMYVELEKSSCKIFGDFDRFRQIVWNLLSNAIRHTPKGGEISICLRRVGSNVELSIEDSGEGISPEFLPYIFDRFRQGDSNFNRKHSGLGIGLSIVKGLVEAHGGQIVVHSLGEGKGARFSISVPVLSVDSGKDLPIPKVNLDKNIAILEGSQY